MKIRRSNPLRTAAALGILTLLPLTACRSGMTSEPPAGSEPVVLPASVASDWAGHVVVVDFWATWCAPCRASSPNVQILHDQFAANDAVIVVGVHADDHNGDPAAYMAEHGYTYASIARGGDIADAFGVHALPTFVVLDREGREVLRHVGMMSLAARQKIAAKVESLLAG